jgi:CHAT domain-containing protein
VSSYAPTFPALYHALEQAMCKSEVHIPRMLLVTNAAQGDLPYVRMEVDVIRSIVPPQVLLDVPISDHTLTVETALAALPDANILHLACHGRQDPTTPFNSGFELVNGRLTLKQLMRVRTPEHAQLAYLSTCDSAAQDRSRPEEGLNLAATMLHAGFKSIIASMW